MLEPLSLLIRCWTFHLEVSLELACDSIAVIQQSKRARSETYQHNKLDSASDGLIMKRPHISW
jgi:hypothetical protein